MLPVAIHKLLEIIAIFSKDDRIADYMVQCILVRIHTPFWIVVDKLDAFLSYLILPPAVEIHQHDARVEISAGHSCSALDFHVI